MSTSNSTSDNVNSVDCSPTLEEFVEMANSNALDKRRITNNSGTIGGGVWSSTPSTGTGLGVAQPLPTVNPNPKTQLYPTWPNSPTSNIDNNHLFKKIVDYTDDDREIHFSDGFKVTAKELKICMKMLLKQAKEEYPEEFI